MVSGLEARLSVNISAQMSGYKEIRALRKLNFISPLFHFVNRFRVYPSLSRVSVLINSLVNFPPSRVTSDALP